MNIINRTIYVTSILLISLSLGGCRPKPTTPLTDKPTTIRIDLDTTIGSLVEVFASNPIGVEGYAIVGALQGTGSSQCPPQVRKYLKQYILRQLPRRNEINIDEFIKSSSTTVVLVDGVIPAVASRNQSFDLRVTALPGTQTTSLQGGWLYEAELKQAGSFGIATRTLAKAKGPIYVDKISTFKTDKKSGYVLAGGTVLNDYKINLALRMPDYKISNAIRNRLNEHFGPDTAKAVSSDMVELKIPPEYKKQKQRFISLIKATYIAKTRQATQKRINKFIKTLAGSDKKQASEIALEAIGNESLPKLAILLNSSNQEVRLRAARCMLNLGGDRGLDVLRQIAMDKESPYRIQALEAITKSAIRNAAAAVSRQLLQDEDFNIRLAAYETLRELDDIFISQKLIANSFYLEQIAQSREKTIFVSRSGLPRIVLFGSPIYCREDLFIQSADGSIILNAPAGQQYVSIMRKHPERLNLAPIQLKSSFELANIIQTLCEEPFRDPDEGRPGLGVPYSEAIALLEKMCNKGAVQAQFRAGALPKIVPIIKK